MNEKPPRRRLSSSDRRREILVAARQLFAVRGYHATTTRDLAAAAGVSDALLYRHFSDKRAVLDGVVDIALSAFSSLPPLERLHERPTEALLRTLGQGFLDRVHASLDLIVILIGNDLDHRDRRLAAFIDDAATALGSDLVRRHPSLSRDHGYLLARSFFGDLIAFVLLQNRLGMEDVHPISESLYLDHAVRTRTEQLP